MDSCYENKRDQKILSPDKTIFGRFESFLILKFKYLLFSENYHFHIIKRLWNDIKKFIYF